MYFQKSIHFLKLRKCSVVVVFTTAENAILQRKMQKEFIINYFLLNLRLGHVLNFWPILSLISS